ncbi:MAG: YIP1 family protein [Bacteroidota bacterium]
MLVRSPVAAYQALLEKRPYSLVRWIVLLGMSPSAGLLYVETLQQFAAEQGAAIQGFPLYLAVLVAAPLTVLIGWLLQSALLTLVSRLAGGRATFRTTMLIFGYAQAPYLLTLPALFLPLGFLPLLLLFLNGLTLFYLYLGLLLAHGLGRGRTLFVLLAGQLLLPLLLTLVAIFGGSAIP